MEPFNVLQFYNGFRCYFKFICSNFDKVIKLFTLSCLHPWRLTKKLSRDSLRPWKMKGEIQCGLHPCEEVNSDNFRYLQIKACGFFVKGYHCHDIVVMSCKHTFNPFFCPRFYGTTIYATFVGMCYILIGGKVLAFMVMIIFMII